VSCYIGGQEAVISTYATAADAQAHPQTMAGSLKGMTTSTWSSGST
jgi:hypothetical protein